MRNKGRSTVSTWLIAVLQQRVVLLALVVAIYLMGAIAGSISVGTLDTSGQQELGSFLRDSLAQLGNVGAKPAGWQGLIVNEVIKPAGLVWLLGMSVVGVPLIAAVVFLRGYVLGFTFFFLLKSMMLKGAALALVALIPQNLLLVPGLALAAAGAVAFSLGALQIVLGRPGTPDIYQHLRREGAVALAGCFLLLMGGALKTYVAPTLAVALSRFLV